MPVSPSQVPPPPSGRPSDKQICHYISEMCLELSHLARRPNFRTISYLLDMARLESEKMGKELPG
ncbi:hypothetical protein D3273_11685 [Lichenibacterium minor]|jgi:hypothetical protein|uniref:Uncharacterized protein n=1 Tax=Lichenibacterium minor TaxID=2316528 RepID=A0A4Q2U7B6_9HYPH|nr:hypothetical protein [Lichenibacterium minor]RYC31788.1 hypothetical protein D3273_11685 [Lichenibacterium minor]